MNVHRGFWGLIPTVALAVSSGLGIAANAQTLNASTNLDGGTPVVFWRLEARSASGLRLPMQEVVRSEDEFLQGWRQMRDTSSYEEFVRIPKAPDIDFSKEVVLALALGQRSTGGYGIRVAGIVHGRGRLEVLVTKSSPGAGCPATTSFTAPTELVRMPIPEKPVVFLVHEVKGTPCE